MVHPLKNMIGLQNEGISTGIYSCCSANPFVLKAALLKGKETGTLVLIESTANQVDQYGGYTGMTPRQFRDFVLDLAREIDFDENRLILGGDHLGPLTFAQLPEAKAMKEAENLVREYVKAGFTKIHLDTSMKLADDDQHSRLPDAVIAQRAARLAAACEEEAENLDGLKPVYVIGSEVPIPGGSQDDSDQLSITSPHDLHLTIQAFMEAFERENLQNAWQRVIAVVVQPGVEERDSGCVEYDRHKAADLSRAGSEYDQLVFEGHSTDYQTREKLSQLVEDGFGILKVGPGLTFAAREALFALAFIEKELLHDKGSHFMEILDEAMCENPNYWIRHYHGTDRELAFKRKYSFSDRSRYYMPDERVEEAMQTMLSNLEQTEIPLSLLSQFMPLQYAKVRRGMLENNPEALILDHIGDTIDDYLTACRQNLLNS